ncbi:hypothetical protein BDY24DRAFT_405490 [Mrakia frigida]|uniref:uncharacterized protein n=1 Tax=Mrakia frigida TaxID=29902 RepID=UPI003FCBF1C4
MSLRKPGSQPPKEEEKKTRIAAPRAQGSTRSAVPLAKAQPSTRPDTPAPHEPIKPRILSNHGGNRQARPPLHSSSSSTLKASSSSKKAVTIPSSRINFARPSGPASTSLAKLASIVDQLSSTVEAQQTRIGELFSTNIRLSSTVVRLSSENEYLRRRDEELHRTLDELSSVSSGRSHWCWEAGVAGRQGRWLWAEERYKASLPPILNNSVPGPNLDTLPTEIFNLVVANLSRSDRLSLCGTSFQMLKLASDTFYPTCKKFTRKLVLQSKSASVFFSARAQLPSDQVRKGLSDLLLPTSLVLDPRSFDPADLLLLPSSSSSTGSPLLIQSLHIITTDPTSSFLQWTPILRLIDPVGLQVARRRSTSATSTSFIVNRQDVDFVDNWTRLAWFHASGPTTIPVLGHDHGFRDLAFAGCLGKSARMVVLREVVEGTSRERDTCLVERNPFGSSNSPRVPIRESPRSISSLEASDLSDRGRWTDWRGRRSGEGFCSSSGKFKLRRF